MAESKTTEGPRKEGDGIASTTYPSNVKMIHKDMPSEMVNYCISSATYKLREYEKGEYRYFKDVAKDIKSDLDKKFEGSWHVIVGKSFGSFVTCEQNRYVRSPISIHLRRVPTCNDRFVRVAESYTFSSVPWDFSFSYTDERIRSQQLHKCYKETKLINQAKMIAYNRETLSPFPRISAVRPFAVRSCLKSSARLTVE